MTCCTIDRRLIFDRKGGRYRFYETRQEKGKEACVDAEVVELYHGFLTCICRFVVYALNTNYIFNSLKVIFLIVNILYSYDTSITMIFSCSNFIKIGIALP